MRLSILLHKKYSTISVGEQKMKMDVVMLVLMTEEETEVMTKRAVSKDAMYRWDFVVCLVIVQNVSDVCNVSQSNDGDAALKDGEWTQDGE